MSNKTLSTSIEQTHGGIRFSDWLSVLSVFNSIKSFKGLILFGTKVLGAFRPGSDIDLALKGLQIPRKELLFIRKELEALHLPRFFDVLHYNSIRNPNVPEHINRVGIELTHETFLSGKH